MSDRSKIAAASKNILFVPLNRLKKSPKNVRKMPHTKADMVHEPLRLVAEFPHLRRRRAKHGWAFALVGDVAEFFVHAIAQHHTARGIGGLHEIVRGAG